MTPLEIVMLGHRGECGARVLIRPDALMVNTSQSLFTGAIELAMLSLEQRQALGRQIAAAAAARR